MPDGRTLGAGMAPFQRALFRVMDADPRRHVYVESGRGAGKTETILGAEATCELYLGPQGGRLFIAAGDRDQAGLVHESVAGWIRRTPPLAGSAEIEKWRIRISATDTVLTVLAADAPSAWGLRPTWIWCDEFAMWPEGYGEHMWHALWSAAPKRRARVVISTTPGWDFDGLCWRVRELALASDAWHVAAITEPAPWLDPAWIEEQRRTLPAPVFARLFEAKWTEGAGAFLLRSEVEAVFSLPDGLPAAWSPVAIGVDLASARDRTAIAVVGYDPRTTLTVVERLLSWAPRAGQRIDLTEVEAELLALARQYASRGVTVCLDPWQAILLGERLRQAGFQVVEFTYTAENRRALFANLLDLVRQARLRARPHEDLRRELLGLEISETATGWRADHRPGKHDDHVMAVALGAWALRYVPPDFPDIAVDRDFVYGVTRTGVTYRRPHRAVGA